MVAQSIPKALIGLGNSDEKYALTYHNAGFLLLDFLAEVPWKDNKAKGFIVSRYREIILVKPLGYMNESGHGAKKALQYFKLLPAETIVAHDDSDLLIGKAKLVFGQGAGGHHGVESVIKAFGTKEFWRLKIGIRHQWQTSPTSSRVIRKQDIASKQSKRIKAGDFVLSQISNKDLDILLRLYQRLRTTVMVNTKPLSPLTIAESGNSALSI